MAATSRLRLYLILYLAIAWQGPIEAIYRPYATHLADAVSAATGASGTSSIEGISSISQNPSYLAGIKDASLSLGFEGVFNLSGFLNFPNVRFEYLPQLAFNLPAQPWGSTGLVTYTSFQNPDLTFGYTLYNFEGIYSVGFFERLYLGVSVGAAMGLVNYIVTGGGPAYSLSALYKDDFISLGILVRPPEVLNHDTYNGFRVQEQTPTRVQGGLTAFFHNWSLIVELDYVDWRSSYFMENGVDITPEFQNGFMDFLHPHIGIDIALKGLLEMNLRLGAYTADSFDFRGVNSRQILFTAGLGALAGSPEWKNKLKIDLSYESGFLPSLIWHENRQLESIRLTLEYVI